MTTRRAFITSSAGALAGLTLPVQRMDAMTGNSDSAWPVVISTWNHGLAANEAAWKILETGGYALDAVEYGVRVTEADPAVMSVGYGGLPDRDGKVTLDASIMDEKGGAGAVSYLQHIMHPISVARVVMEKTPHVLLSGEGAYRFAISQGFKKENLLTPEANKAWKEWKKKDGTFKPVVNIEKEVKSNHDTIGMLAIDDRGRLCGACTTSGMAYKMDGRVGDSPIIGAGLFVDGEIGGAVATGTGELVMKTLGSFLVVEMMRNGFEPGDACKEAVKRIVKKIPGYRHHQIGFIAIDKNGRVGSFCLQPGFDYAIRNTSVKELRKVKSWIE